MINKAGIQLYSDLAIFCMFLFIKSLCASLGPRQSTFSVLPISLTRMMTKGTVHIQFS